VRFPDAIVTGFNTLTHKIKAISADYCLKDSIGGINVLFGRHLFPLIEPCLSAMEWDWKLCTVMQEAGKQFVVSRPSVVQHLGSHGLTSSPHRGVPVAVDFRARNTDQRRLSRIHRRHQN
jgi:hypothetical protein